MAYKVRAGIGLLVAATVLGFVGCGTSRQNATDSSLSVGSSELGGVVTSAKGAEAGVWVIAETTDLPTKFTKIVVTDDKGRFLIPELPRASYDVFVRGYGLVDSPKVRAEPGRQLNLNAVIAPSAAAASEYYPPIYWYSMMKIPDQKEFPGTGSSGNGIGNGMRTQAHWLNQVKTNGCVQCHAMGTKGTRTIPKELGQFPSSFEAWGRRIASGQAMTNMTNIAGVTGTHALTQFADWTDRIAAGELPFAQPSRPQGVERNVVLTMWDYGTPTMYVHDVISSDKRNPTVNANGKVYVSAEASTDDLPVVDPIRHVATSVRHPVRDPKTPSSKNAPMAPSPYWGPNPIWDSQSNTHNPMMDEKARVWFTAVVRPPANPAFCQKGSDHPAARAFPITAAGRHLSMYDPASEKFTLISTCFSTHHLIFAEDANNTLWANGGGNGLPLLGWLNRKMFEETGDEVKSQGWTPFILDTNGNGRRDDYVEPNQAVDPNKDKRFQFGLYSVGVNPVDNSVWGTTNANAAFPGYVLRLNPGADPVKTALAEVYEIAAPGYGPRGGDIDRNGVYWVSLSSGHLGSFDRRKCKGPLNGPAAATGRHCPEGWTLYPLPGPQFAGLKETGSAESSYYTWVDQFDVFGLGKNVPIVTGNLNDSLLALVDGKFINLRVPYPMGFYPKWADGRIDDAKAGWKGRGMWSTYATRANFHSEGGTARKSQVVKFQLRPDPLAR